MHTFLHNGFNNAVAKKSSQRVELCGLKLNHIIMARPGCIILYYNKCFAKLELNSNFKFFELRDIFRENNVNWLKVVHIFREIVVLVPFFIYMEFFVKSSTVNNIIWFILTNFFVKSFFLHKRIIFLTSRWFHEKVRFSRIFFSNLHFSLAVGHHPY